MLTAGEGTWRNCQRGLQQTLAEAEKTAFPRGENGLCGTFSHHIAFMFLVDCPRNNRLFYNLICRRSGRCFRRRESWRQLCKIPRTCTKNIFGLQRHSHGNKILYITAYYRTNSYFSCSSCFRPRMSCLRTLNHQGMRHGRADSADPTP